MAPCPYCGHPSKLVSGKVVYPARNDLAGRRYFYCDPCQAWTGQNAHGKPNGTLANAELRKARAKAHAALDPLWKSEAMSRNACYRWLSDTLGIPKSECHIQQFDLGLCARVVEAVSRRTN